jgi:hypothetical protein
MKERVYLICYKNDYFRKGQIANIVGMKRKTEFTNSVYNMMKSSEICYHIIFEDGQEDYVSMSEVNESINDWRFVTLAELLMRGQSK